MTASPAVSIQTGGLDPGTLQHYPMDMRRFGLNPFGENRFRIVRASSRRFLIVGPTVQWSLLYPHIGERWILEEWQDAFTFSGVTSAGWDANPDLKILGPYPSRGDYQMCGNTSFDPAQTDIEKLIRYVHAGDRYSWAQKLAACHVAAEKDKADRKSLCRDIVMDALPSFALAPGVGYGGSFGLPKSSPVRITAQQTGLPIPKQRRGQVTSSAMMGGRWLPKKKVKVRLAK